MGGASLRRVGFDRCFCRGGATGASGDSDGGLQMGLVGAGGQGRSGGASQSGDGWTLWDSREVVDERDWCL